METTPSVVYHYDGSFDGFLSVVFEAFERKAGPMAIQIRGKGSHDLFAENVETETDPARADRVWQGLIKHTNTRNARMVYTAFLSETQGIEMLLWFYLKKVFTSPHKDFYRNMLDDDVNNVVQKARKVQREAHRFLGLVRFQKTADGLFFALIEPDHNILWLMARHFKSRYASQKWIIYDTRRKYGIFYDLETVQEVQIENPAVNMTSGRVHEQVRDMDEDHFRKLWQAYYDSINIEQRANPRQMVRMMPRRYWKYLPEKNNDEM